MTTTHDRLLDEVRILKAKAEAVTERCDAVIAKLDQMGDIAKVASTSNSGDDRIAKIYHFRKGMAS